MAMTAEQMKISHQMVGLSHIRKSFGDVEVVKGIDLSIAKGEFFSFRAIRLRQNNIVADDCRSGNTR